jgi:cytidyltransferase-like protein
MLNSFRKIKKRAGGLINQGALEQFNLLIQGIQKRVESVNESSIYESEMPTFLDFKRKNSDKNKVNYITEETEETEEKEDPFYSYNEFISALETIDTTKKKNLNLIEEDKEEGKKLEDVNILIGRFQPFHNGHLKMAKAMKEKNNLPCIVAVVHPGHNSSGKSPFDEDLVKKYIDY